MGPDFICLGAQKAGTGWLSQCLQRHPGLWNPGHKEFHFFDRAEMSSELNQLTATPRKVVLTKLKKGSLDINPSLQESILKSKIITFEQYIDFYGNAPSSKKTWEITPRYGAMKAEMIAQMNQLLPNTKYLYIVREPVSRALSSLRMWLERGLKSNEPQEAIIARWMKNQLDRGRYSKNITNINQHLIKDEKIKYFPFGLIKTNPLQVLRMLEEHLDIPASDYDGIYNNAYHQTNKVVEIPESAISHIKEELSEEVSFLRNFFGDDFTSNC